MFRLPSAVSLLARLGVETPLRQMRDARLVIGDRTFGYGVVEGDGATVVLLHGWGLAHGSYRKAAEAVAAAGFRVVVPDLPGFGTSSSPPLAGLTIRRYAALLATFLECCDDVGTGKVHLVGHSFGGAVAAQLAHDRPELVASVVLVSSVSSATWEHGAEADRRLDERPLWDWGVHLVHEFPLGRFPVAALGVLKDLSHNVVRHLPTMGVVVDMIRKNDLADELSLVAKRSLPVAVVRARGDRVVTEACFLDQCRLVGTNGTIVEGNHGWPIARPASFGRTIGDIILTMSKKASEQH